MVNRIDVTGHFQIHLKNGIGDSFHVILREKVYMDVWTKLLQFRGF